jgi:hypothetical protein
MLNADSRALKNEIDVHASATPPTMPSVAAFRCTERTALTIDETDVPGKIRLSSVTR